MKMKEITLNPNEVLVHELYLGDEEVLRGYIFDYEKRIEVPRIVVVNSRLFVHGPSVYRERGRSDEIAFNNALHFDNEFKRVITPYEDELRELYYLLEGNHRTIAAVVTGNEIDAYELEDQREEVYLLRELEDNGKIPPFRRSEKTIEELFYAWEQHAKRNGGEYIRTVDEKFKLMVKRGLLPKDVIEKHRKNNATPQ